MRHTVLSFLVAAAAASSALAQTVSLHSGAYSFGVGGEFNAVFHSYALTPVALTNSGAFETFCLERTETFRPGDQYNFTIDTVALLGAGGAVGGMDPLDERTAFLYDAFITGVLPTYDYSNGLGSRQSLAGALQNAIWYLEQEVATLDTPEAAFFYNFAQGGIGRGLGDVRVLNLYRLDEHGQMEHHQSQIFKLPTPGATTLAAIAAVTMLRRRRR